MHTIADRVAAITEDRRADYFWPTKEAASTLHIHPNKFSDWWYRTRGKLIDLYLAMPGETATELMSIIAQAEVERQRRTTET